MSGDCHQTVELSADLAEGSPYPPVRDLMYAQGPYAAYEKFLVTRESSYCSNFLFFKYIQNVK